MTISLSLPPELLEEIDAQRGDVSRSKFVAKILEEKVKGGRYHDNR